MNTLFRIAAVTVLAAAATPAATAQGLFGPSGNAATPSHDFAPAKKAEGVEPKASAKAAPAARAERRPATPSAPAREVVSARTAEAPAPTADSTDVAVSDEPQVEAPAEAETAAPAVDAAPQDDDTIPFMHEDAASPEAEAPSAGGLVARTIGALLIVVGLLVGAAFAMRRLGGPRFGAPRTDGPELAILSSVALGDRRSLTVVKFGDRTLLLGSTTSGITLLAEDDDEPPTPVRSVGYLLEADGETSFDDELLRASERTRGGLLS